MELKYFDKRYASESLDWYKNQFPEVPEDQLIFEKSPSYVRNKRVAKRIQKTIPNVKLILAVRDPVKR